MVSSGLMIFGLILDLSLCRFVWIRVLFGLKFGVSLNWRLAGKFNAGRCSTEVILFRTTPG
jgi:hypothetical protein